MRNEQIEIEGIGQQLATLKDWKTNNKVFTHKSDGYEPEELPWSAWGDIEDPNECMSDFGEQAFCYAETEREVILEHCLKNNIKAPFWW